jgi:hypothetical protein
LTGNKTSANNVNTVQTAPFDTQAVGGYCIPAWSALATVGKDLYKLLDTKSGGTLSKYMVDLAESWKVLAGMAFGTLVITILYIVLLRWITKILLYTSLVGLLLFGSAFAGWNIWKYTQAAPNSVDSKTALYIGIAAGVVTLIYIICLCCMWSSIALGAAVIEACSDFVGSTTRIGLVPTVTFIFYLPVFCWWAIGSVFIIATGTFKYNPGDAFPTSSLK